MTRAASPRRSASPITCWTTRSRFRDEVIDRFVDSYLAGETPVPCIECNRQIKFRDLLNTARDLGAAALATGHYIASRALPGGSRGLYRAADADRDQSYFLYATTPEQLSLLRFPLGEMHQERSSRAGARTRPLGRRQARQPGHLLRAHGRYTDVIEKLKPEAASPGEIVHLDGRVLGRHAGVMHYTVGQRQGLGIASGQPLYVVSIDGNAGKVVVGPREALRRTRSGCARSTGSATANWTASARRHGDRRSRPLHPRSAGSHAPACAAARPRSSLPKASMASRRDRPAFLRFGSTRARGSWAAA